VDWGNSMNREGMVRLRNKQKALPRVAAVILAVLMPGCAHDDDQWAPLMYLQAEIADGLAETYCSVRRLFSSDLPSSEFAAHADPELIALAKRDAHRACLRRLEADSEERARRLPGRNNL
jgi:hypothetical protein